MCSSASKRYRYTDARPWPVTATKLKSKKDLSEPVSVCLRIHSLFSADRTVFCYINAAVIFEYTVS